MRRLVVFGSVKGAPGVTTSVLALAAAWPVAKDRGVRPVAVEADCSGGDVAVRFGVPHTPGLLDVATAARQPCPGSVLGAAGELPFGVRVVAAPAGHGTCTEAVRLLAAESGRRVLTGEASDTGTVLVDVGRLREEVKGLWAAADSAVLVTRGEADALAHAYAYLLDRDLHARPVVVAVVGQCRYSSAEIRDALGLDHVVLLPWDPRAAQILAGRSQAELRRHGWRTPSLMTAAGRMAEHIHGPGAQTTGSERLVGAVAAPSPRAEVGSSDVPREGSSS
ncbi:hypothetical protein AB0H77_04695 [Streptomyces sp. NPDC050844]|uniref:MinD/ParA family ATP-binding protein n=1 Tax=Streptomyces sp. NPDC050844 TaxID=3155790 RepID=UPI0033E790D7